MRNCIKRNKFVEYIAAMFAFKWIFGSSCVVNSFDMILKALLGGTSLEIDLKNLEIEKMKEW